MKKTILFTIVLCFLVKPSFGQNKMRPNNIDTVSFQLSPKDKHVVINGFSLGYQVHPWSTLVDSFFVEMNGLNIELGPLGLVGAIYGIAYGLIGVKDTSGHKTNLFSKNGYPDSANHVKYGTFVNGVSLSVGGIEGTFNKGVFINGLSCFSYTIRGLLISGLLNTNYMVRGLSIAGFANVSQNVHGVQIGLFNKCETGRVLQIGLFNRIGKRVIPLINFKFRKK